LTHAEHIHRLRQCNQRFGDTALAVTTDAPADVSAYASRESSSVDVLQCARSASDRVAWRARPRRHPAARGLRDAGAVGEPLQQRVGDGCWIVTHQMPT